MQAKIPIRKGRHLEQMREAGRVASDILKATAKVVEPGVTTRDVEEVAIGLIEEAGCESAFHGYRNFPGHICISLNEEVVHGIGSQQRTIQYGDILKIDVGIVKDGWVGDNALTVPVGDIDPEVRRLLQVTEESLYVAIDHARAGGRLGELCHSVEKHILGNGFSVVREYVGHGVGRKLHEEPQVPNHWNFGRDGKGAMLREGMILAIEPMVNLGTEKTRTLADRWTVVTLDGKPSAHFEHTVLVGPDGGEILTPRPRFAGG
ncbi:MAG: type I methionyl aminopeptidase [Verrucomicrobiota bacterium]